MEWYNCWMEEDHEQRNVGSTTWKRQENGISLRAQREPVLLILTLAQWDWLWIFGLQSCKKNLHCFKLLSLWQFLKASTSGLPFPSPMNESEKWKWSRSVASDSSRPRGLQPTRLLHPWDFLGKSTGVGCHCLLWKESIGYFNCCWWFPLR